MSPSELIAAVRKRPGMYVGNTQDATGVHQMLWELVANSLDEHIAGFGDEIEVVLHADGSASVADHGRGFSTELDDDVGRSFVECCLTEPHFTATRDGHWPHVHVASWGVGLAVVSGLSDELSIEIEREGRRWRVEAARGEIVAPLQQTTPNGVPGMRVRFRPDTSLLPFATFDHTEICRHLNEIAALDGAVRFVVRDERAGSEALIEHPEGLEGLLSLGLVEATSVVPLGTDLPGGNLDAVFRWGERGEPIIRSYAQLRETCEGGSHVTGFLRGLVETAHWIDKRAGRRAETRRALLEGIEVVLHVRLFNSPIYGGPTKSRIDDPELEKAVYDAVKAEARGVLASNHQLLAAVLEREAPT